MQTWPVRSVALMLALGLAGACAPRPTPSPPPMAPAAPGGAPLWRVAGTNGDSYLFGTIHLPLDADEALGPRGRRAFTTARALYVEMDLTDPARTQALAGRYAHAGLLPPGESLERMLSPARWRALRRLLPSTAPAVLDRMQPWLASLTVIQAIAVRGSATPAAAPGRQGPTIDAALVTRARAAHVPVHELDTLAQQLTAFTTMSRADAVATLGELLDAPDAASGELRAMVAAYDGPNAEAHLTAVVDQMARRTPTFAEYLLFQRTARWATTLAPVLRGGGAFVAVGAGHLVGPRGLPALLAARGFRVTRVE